MRSKKSKKKNRGEKASGIKGPVLTLKSFNITYDSIEEENFQRLPSEVKDEIRIIYEIIRTKPAEGIKRCKKLMDEYPNIPVLFNYLSVGYMKIKDRQASEEIVEETYRRFPNYLFARCNYANICLERDEVNQIPKIFQGKYDLKALYPKRNEFHISEFISFASTMAMYFDKIGKRDAAELYFDILNKIEPRHPLTKKVKRILYPTALMQLVKRLSEMGSQRDK